MIAKPMFFDRCRFLGLIMLLSPCCTLFAQNADLEKKEPTILLWPQGLPADAQSVAADTIEKQKRAEQKRPEIIAYVGNPSLTVFQPAEANGCAMIVCPGGGYNILAWRKEGVELAKYLNTFGVTVFVLKYRVPRRDLERIHWEPLQDVQRAIRLVRANAEKWKVDRQRIGVMGFSAGGHLTVMAGTEYATQSYQRIDKVDQVSARPDFICPIYAAYLGDDYQDDRAKLSTKLKLDSNVPPTFLAVTSDDKMRGAQAALLYVRLRELNVPAEVHVYTKGGHGYGIRPSQKPVGTWHHRLTDWLKSLEFLD